MKKCPKCGGKLIKIIYGLPGPELADKAHRHECLLGGCEVIEGYDPELYCSDCNTAFSKDLKEDFPNYCETKE